MKLFGSMTIAFFMYSKIPVSQMEWTKGRMKYVVCFFPLVGAAQGILLCIFALPARRWEFWVLYYVGSMALPILVNGGTHVDGSLDVVDVRALPRDKEEKLEISKDPHVGSPTILRAIIYVLLYPGIFAELPAAFLSAVGGIHVLTKAVSNLSIVWLPKAESSGLAATFSEDAQKKTVTVTIFLFAAASLCFILWVAGMATGILYALAALAVYAYHYRMSIKEFGGITGDLAGYFLQTYELVLTAALAVSLRI